MCTAFTMIHFHSVFWRSPASYPLFNYFPVLLESFLIASTILVCALDALTQILLEGSITRTILCRNGSLMPRWEDDCSVVITRLGTASLEATSVAGLGNEVASVTIFDTLAQGLGNDTDDPTAMELDRAGIFSPGDLAHGRQMGFLNEVKNVKAISMHDPGQFEVRSLFWKELERYLKGWLRVMKGTWILVRYGRRLRRLVPAPSSIPPDCEGAADETIMAEGDEDNYRRFLLGEAISDDEDEYNHTAHTPSSSHSSSDNEEEDHPAELYHNFTSDESSAGPVLLAHMVNPSSFPLTRRRYQKLIANAGQHEIPTIDPPMNSGMSNLRRRRELTELSADEGWNESRMNCVICTAGPRQVICWPCR